MINCGVQGHRRTGGSALAQVYSQLGAGTPDVDIPQLGAAFSVTQRLINGGTVLAGHDISDGGIAVALLEMAFSGVAGVRADLPDPENSGAHAVLFAEEVGLVLEVDADAAEAVVAAYAAADVPCSVIGATTEAPMCSLRVEGAEVVKAPSAALRDIWEEASFALERLQACLPPPRCSLTVSWHH